MTYDASVSSVQMRQWRDCNGPQERRQAVVEAMRVARGVKAHAAKLLGMSRQHFYRVLTVETESVTSDVLPDTRYGRDARVAVRRLIDTVSVTQPCASVGKSLTPASHAPNFPRVTRAATAAEVEHEEGTEAMGRILIPLPKHCLDWLEQTALRRKQETGASRMSKAPIVVELIEDAMRREGDR